jgi:hypothetical protein
MTVEDILAVLQALPRGRSAVLTVGHCLGWLDSRALAALFKELHKASLAPLAAELFDWLRELPPGHEYGPLLDVYTYTTMIVRFLFFKKLAAPSSAAACFVRFVDCF